MFLILDLGFRLWGLGKWFELKFISGQWRLILDSGIEMAGLAEFRAGDPENLTAFRSWQFGGAEFRV